MTCESDETEHSDVLAPVGDRRSGANVLDPDELERQRRDWVCHAVPDGDEDEFEGFDEDDFDDDFDDDFEEEQEEEYDAENEEYPDTDFGTGADLEEEIGEIDIEGDIAGDFDEAEPGEEADISTDDADEDSGPVVEE